MWLLLLSLVAPLSLICWLITMFYSYVHNGKYVDCQLNCECTVDKQKQFGERPSYCTCYKQIRVQHVIVFFYNIKKRLTRTKNKTFCLSLNSLGIWFFCLCVCVCGWGVVVFCFVFYLIQCKKKSVLFNVVVFFIKKKPLGDYMCNYICNMPLSGFPFLLIIF